MNKYVKLLVAVSAVLVYGLILRFIAPNHEPYFLLGLVLIGYIAWLYGISAGLGTALLLLPLTIYIYNHQFDVSSNYSAFINSPPYIGIECLAAILFGRVRRSHRLLCQKMDALERSNVRLESALGNVRELGGIHAICSTCKKITSDEGGWIAIDNYLKQKTKIEFTHGICPDCAHEYNKQMNRS